MTKTDGYRLVSLYVLALFLYSPLPSMADARNTETPTVLSGGKIITAAEAKQLLDKEKVFLADCRSAFNYGKGHIPTAKHISYQHTYKKSASGTKPTLKNTDISKLPSEKDAAIIFYSHGSTGWKSYKAARAAIEAGYSRVLWLRGGLNEWIKTGYSVKY